MSKQLPATLAAMAVVLSTISVHAQTPSPAGRLHHPSRKAAAKKPVESSLAREIRELREQMINQQAEIDELKRANSDLDARLAGARSGADAATASASAAAEQARSLQQLIQANSSSVQTLASDLSDLKLANTTLNTTLATTTRDLNEKIDSPTTIHYKGVTITPVAFFAAESVYRTRSINSDINTPFNNTPFRGAAEANTSELNFSGRQSRLGALFTGNAGSFKLSGYVEGDFLSAGTTSNENESNSYTFRQRQIWGQASRGRFTFTGGQMWSLVTENKTSTDVRTEALPNTVDPQYHVGFSWARQDALRFQGQITPTVTVAAAIEEGQNLFSASNANSNFFFGGAGTAPGLLNPLANYSNDIGPDVIVKTAFDPPHAGHYEVGGLARFFRDRVYPGATSTPASTTAASNDTKTGGGVFANARFPLTGFLDLGFHGLWGKGVGRYGTATLPDTTVHPDGRLAPIGGGQALFSLETHPTKKLDIYAYGGGEYAQRTTYLSNIPGPSFGKLVGYAPLTGINTGCNTETLPTAATGYAPGTPANCLGATRVVLEGSGGFTYRLASSPKLGRLQYQMVYSYLTRNAWTGIGGAPHAVNNMVFTGIRYYIP